MTVKERIRGVSALLAAAVLMAAGCGVNSGEGEASYPTPDDFEPEYYSSEADVPDGAYCIVHETEDGSLLYYPLYVAESTIGDVNSSASGADASRLWWVNYNVDEGLLPTMYGGDYIIYKSYSAMPMTFSLEKFYDGGYTLGICGLKKDSSGHWQYDAEDGGYVLTTGDLAELDAVDADSIFMAYIDGEKVTGQMVSESGTILGLELMQTYECDVRIGTQSNMVTLTANAHYFTSAETYVSGTFEFVSEYVARIDMPEYAGTGYYGLNGAGYFRYVEDGTDYHSLDAADYNGTIYAYDGDGNITGASDGKYAFDGDGFLAEADEIAAESTEEAYVPDYEAMEDLSEVEEALGTELVPAAETEDAAEPEPVPEAVTEPESASETVPESESVSAAETGAAESGSEPVADGGSVIPADGTE